MRKPLLPVHPRTLGRERLLGRLTAVPLIVNVVQRSQDAQREDVALERGEFGLDPLKRTCVGVGDAFCETSGFSTLRVR